jgi:hypothetical protein
MLQCGCQRSRVHRVMEAAITRKIEMPPPAWPGLRSVPRNSYPISWPIQSGNAKLNRSTPDAIETYCLPCTA